MKSQCQQMYDHLLAGIGLRRQQASSENKWIEECFQLSFTICNRLQEMIDDYRFTDLQEEIWFFKTMKPQFSGQMEYFVLVYMSAVFAPEDAIGRVNYWQQELKRNQVFLSKHEDFYQYYKGGRTEFDPQYFVRSTTSYADLAATLIARERYLEYLQSKITPLTPSF